MPESTTSNELGNAKPSKSAPIYVTAAISLAALLAYLVLTVWFEKPTGWFAVNENLLPQEGLFSYTKEQSKPQLSELDVQKKLSEFAGAHVYVAPVDGSGLYIAIINGQVYYTEPTAQLLIKGDVYSLHRSEYLSERFESELRYSRDLLAARKSSKRPFSPFSSVSEQHLDKPSPRKLDVSTVQSDDDVSVEPLHTKTELPKAAATNSQMTHAKRLSVQGANSPAFSLETQSEGDVNPVLLDIARSLSPSNPSFSSACLQIAQGARDISELSSLFSEIPQDNGAQEKCGMTFAQKSLPQFADNDLITYKAMGEEKAVINIMSDYTCSFCARFHRRIPALNAEGITVRVFPYGRADYFTDTGRPNIFANNFAAALCVNPTERTKVFEDLLLNFRTYSNEPYPSIQPTADCMTRAITYKLIGNIFNTVHQTPLIFYSNGQSQVGDSLTSVSAIVRRALSI